MDITNIMLGIMVMWILSAFIFWWQFAYPMTEYNRPWAALALSFVIPVVAGLVFYDAFLRDPWNRLTRKVGWN